MNTSQYAEACGVYRATIFVTYCDLIRAVDLAKESQAPQKVIAAIDQALDAIEKCAAEIKKISGESPIEISEKYRKEFEDLCWPKAQKEEELVKKAEGA